MAVKDCGGVEVQSFRVLTLAELIDTLAEIGGGMVVGFDGRLHSDRGDYEVSATTPCDDMFTGTELAVMYGGEVGKGMRGWKGGVFPCSSDKRVHYAQPGDRGPVVIGVEKSSGWAYRPVLLDLGDHYLD